MYLDEIVSVKESPCIKKWQTDFNVFELKVLKQEKLKKYHIVYVAYLIHPA